MDISPFLKACKTLIDLKMVSSETDDSPLKEKISWSVQVSPMGFIAVACCLALAAVVSNALIENFWSLDGWLLDVCICLSVLRVCEGRYDHTWRTWRYTRRQFKCLFRTWWEGMCWSESCFLEIIQTLETPPPRGFLDSYRYNLWVDTINAFYF